MEIFDLKTTLPLIGYFGIFFIVFAESGLFFGFFLPGDSLLFTAGFLASQWIFDIGTLAVICFLAAVLGDSVGYTFGRKVGKKLFTKEDSFLFHKDHLVKARLFYEKYGKKTIFLARFLPFVRTFAPIVAGVGQMHYPTFLTYNLAGGLSWGVGITLAGFFLGRIIPGVDKYLLPVIVVIIILSVSPTIYHLLKERNANSKSTSEKH